MSMLSIQGDRQILGQILWSNGCLSNCDPPIFSFSSINVPTSKYSSLSVFVLIGIVKVPLDVLAK